MFMLSVKLSRKRILFGAVALLLVAGIGVTGVRLVGRGASASVTMTGETPEKVKTQKVTAKSAEDRLSYIRSFGWEANEEPAEVLEVIIPEEFDQVYMDYNSIQKQQGFNLEKFSGKRVKRYSYVITNYPGAEGEVRFNLLMHGDKVIGGDVCTLDANGFMHGFSPQI